MKEFKLSVVVASRNDNHGGGLLRRTRASINSIIHQANAHNIKTEIIIVEWNPPSHKQSLADALEIKNNLGLCSLRFITVPQYVHEKYENSKSMPLFQMIAKNVGIRRARGEFILATNIDIIFPEKIFKAIKNKIKIGYLYRVDRVDVLKKISYPATNTEKLLKKCHKNVIRIHLKGRSLVMGRAINDNFGGIVAIIIQEIIFKNFEKILKIIFSKFLKIKNILLKFLRSTIQNVLYGINLRVRFPGLFFLCEEINKLTQLVPRVLIFKIRDFFEIISRRRTSLHTNACGDFTLMHREDWSRLRGYIELPISSMHHDSILLFQAQLAGIQERYLGWAYRVYHIDHSGGFIVENKEHLDEILRERKVKQLDWNDDCVKLIEIMRERKSKGVVNAYCLSDENWGLINHNFQEVIIGKSD